MQSYSVRKFLESRVSGEAHRYVPSSQSLSTLNYMNQMTQIVNNEDTNLAKVAGETMKYSSAAVSALANNPGLQNTYGGGLSGVETLEGQLQQHQSKRVFEKVMDKVLDDADKDDTQKSTHNKFNVEGTLKQLNLGTVKKKPEAV